MLNITIRNISDDDKSWVVHSWTESQIRDMQLRVQRDQELIERPSFLFNQDLLWASHALLVNDMLDKHNTLVACNPDDLDQTFGYVVFNDDKLYWIYVKKIFRTEHIATRLMKASFPMFKEMPISIPTVTYSISHYKDKWSLVKERGLYG